MAASSRTSVVIHVEHVRRCTGGNSIALAITIKCDRRRHMAAIHCTTMRFCRHTACAPRQPGRKASQTPGRRHCKRARPRLSAASSPAPWRHVRLLLKASPTGCSAGLHRGCASSVISSTEAPLSPQPWTAWRHSAAGGCSLPMMRVWVWFALTVFEMSIARVRRSYPHCRGAIKEATGAHSSVCSS